jgi:hypothetical protein
MLDDVPPSEFPKLLIDAATEDEVDALIDPEPDWLNDAEDADVVVLEEVEDTDVEEDTVPEKDPEEPKVFNEVALDALEDSLEDEVDGIEDDGEEVVDMGDVDEEPVGIDDEEVVDIDDEEEVADIEDDEEVVDIEDDDEDVADIEDDDEEVAVTEDEEEEVVDAEEDDEEVVVTEDEEEEVVDTEEDDDEDVEIEDDELANTGHNDDGGPSGQACAWTTAVSSVTASPRTNRPPRLETPLLTVTAAEARMFPAKLVSIPKVARFPTDQ